MFWIDHVGIVVRDLETSIEFYTRLFGSGPVERVSWRGENGVYVARMLGRSPEGFALDAAFFQVPYTNALIEMLQYSGFEQGQAATPPTDVGATHLGFYVESLSDTIERLGVPLTGDPVDIPYGPYRGGRTAYLRDPNGINVQLMELRGRPGNLPVLRRGDPPPEVG
jgi:catechol 2,3-dioxygenase-like lactoylglutathione lyase family enzyme